MIVDSLQTVATVLERQTLSAENFCLRLLCPEVARRIRPGQFFMLRLPGRTDPLLGRPFALYDTVIDEAGNCQAFDVGIHVVGKATALLDQLTAGDNLEIWGPLGNGFPELETDHLIQVAGGIGYTPFVAVSRAALSGKSYANGKYRLQARQASLIYGVRSQKYRADLSDWSDLPGLTTHLCTEDGSEGYRGFVTGPLEQLLQEPATGKRTVFTCGPLAMMYEVARLCEQYQTECWASLETPMACGYGACFSCVVPVKDEQSDCGWDYRRSCVEGPVFAADKLHWNQLAGKTPVASAKP